MRKVCNPSQVAKQLCHPPCWKRRAVLSWEQTRLGASRVGAGMMMRAVGDQSARHLKVEMRKRRPVAAQERLWGSELEMAKKRAHFLSGAGSYLGFWQCFHCR